MATDKKETSKEVKETEVKDAQEVTETSKENTTANPAEVKETKKPAAKKKAKKTTSKKKKIKVLASNLAGKYLLPYNPGQVVELEAKQAQEMIDAGDAKEA